MTFGRAQAREHAVGTSAPRQVGRYAVLGRLASGGMASVHVGRSQGEGGGIVAIKRLHAELARDPSVVAMFSAEAHLAARINHPNVVSTLDVVSTDGELFLVMEYVHGQSLSWLVKEVAKLGERIPPRVVTSIVTGALNGLHAAHEARDESGQPLGIVHRDVSPQNVIVGVDGRARVLDFGLAKAQLDELDQGVLQGKLAYMAPEQIRGDVVTRQADIYAAGVMLWEALTGARLFKAETESGTLARIVAGEAPPPSGLADGIPPALDRVVMKALARDPSDRYATALEMAADLSRALAPAATADVAEWLARVAKTELDERAARIAAIEAGPVRAPMTSATDLAYAIPASQRALGSPARVLGALGIFCAATAAGAVLWMTVGHSTVPRASAAATPPMAAPEPSAPPQAVPTGHDAGAPPKTSSEL